MLNWVEIFHNIKQAIHYRSIFFQDIKKIIAIP